MPAIDPNNAKWFWLGYPRDFEPQPPGPYNPALPLVDSSAFFDNARHVLELLPVRPEEELQLLPGTAVDVNGEVYRSEDGSITVERCNGTRDILPCDPFVFAGPRGLALDRRGYLYVADARAHRVVVILPDDGSVQGILSHPDMREPVDVAVSPWGLVYVADRGGEDAAGSHAAGKVHVFNARLQFVLAFAPINGEGLPTTPRPVSIMIEPDGTVAVADGTHPRRLRFSAVGEPLADLHATIAAPLDGALIQAIYGKDAPRFLPGACRPPRPAHDGGEALAAAHRSLRLHMLSLGGRFATDGTVISGSLDSGTPGTSWHRVELHADIPSGTSITVETSTSDDRDTFDPLLTSWTAPRDNTGEPIAFTRSSRGFISREENHLILSLPARFLWLRITLHGDGKSTPSLRAIRVLYPRVSYLDLLPRVFRQDPESAQFLERYLALFEHVLTSIEDKYEEFSRQINPDAAPPEVIDWLACLVDLSFDPSWSLERRRALVATAMELYRLRGTPEGIRKYVEIYLGSRPELIEQFLERPVRAPVLGRSGTILGCAVPLIPCGSDPTPQEQLYRSHAHRFRVLLYVDDRCDAETVAAVVDRIVRVSRPAHTEHDVCLIYPDARLQLQSQVGVDFVLGGRWAANLELPREGPESGSLIGRDAVLGNRHSQYVRRREFQI